VLLTAENRGDGSRLANVAHTIEVVTKRLGFGPLLLWLVAALGRRFSIHIFVVTTRPIDDQHTDADVAQSGLEPRILTCQDVARFFDRDQGHSYQYAFATDALARGDRCFGVLKGNRLLWYCWYARGPAPVFDGVDAAVDRPFLYVYNAHTDDAYRGRRLHSIGAQASGCFFAREGYRAFTAYIEATNLPALIASRRMGERFVGLAVVRRTAGGARWFVTRGCKKAGFRLMQTCEGSQPTPVSAERYVGRSLE
jgi:hypothetical protein